MLKSSQVTYILAQGLKMSKGVNFNGNIKDLQFLTLRRTDKNNMAKSNKTGHSKYMKNPPYKQNLIYNTCCNHC